ncbi:uncharacterized protein B0P05DRAFT_564091 [Gilbertella persicaria]|uniref:NADH:flavin oxidoreductase/NADH oxidase N-terminal domain-containing protein n=1 Tax=Rhizopus stolonifer TaxID=4846 RepID=A0A367JFF0_RHIST|nr:uncharacterized protein B0P05DRAFT_564091 [Gilbertella persicaria]KAI8048945.1 hypothetical protein B0P05DRAFT_564091 [Gilbertella persicaria]RCH88461.1 hypothetical protein CU098_002058 [Rhizopus stolonifer]
MSFFSVQPQAFNNKPETGSVVNAVSETTPRLFTPITCKSVTFHNRIVVPPMCMYSATDGFMNDFHVSHYGSFAMKGAGLIIIEATAVEPRGRISNHDLGLWSDQHIEPLKRVVEFIKSQGSVPGIQIAHAGRKANMASPFNGYKLISEEEGGWPNDVVGPSDLPFDRQYAQPKALTIHEMKEITQKWVEAAIRADKAGIQVLEIHSAHGYLLHNFLSGNSNKRTDAYGGSLENRLRYPLEVVKAVRDVWPQDKPLWVRFSGTDFKNPNALGHDQDGWDIHQSVAYAKALKEIGVDVMDVSAGGNLPITYSVGPLYQVPLADTIKKQVNISTGAVGLITEPKQAEDILQEGKADYILIGREYLRNSAWAYRAAQEFGVDVKWNNQYARAKRIPKL